MTPLEKRYLTLFLGHTLYICLARAEILKYHCCTAEKVIA